MTDVSDQRLPTEISSEIPLDPPSVVINAEVDDISLLAEKAALFIKQAQQCLPEKESVSDGEPGAIAPYMMKMARFVLNTPIDATHVLVVNNNDLMFAHAELLSGKSIYSCTLDRMKANLQQFQVDWYLRLATLMFCRR